VHPEAPRPSPFLNLHMTRSQPPSGFVTIGSGIYVNLAPLTKVAVQPDDSAPNVILIFGWMGAKTRHLQHYSRKYSELYPCATQIIVKCGPSFIWTSERRKQNRLLPVVEVLESLGCFPSINDSAQETPCISPRILIHSFSNGGGIQMTSLGRLLSSKYPPIPPSRNIVSAIVVDSAPSTGDFRTIGMAFSIAIRNPVVRYVVLFFIFVIHAVRLSLEAGFGVETMATRYVKTLLQPNFLSWVNARTPRLYVFSNKDELVPLEAVQQHVDAGKALGLNVRSEVYHESAHVAHMRLNPERYWRSIQDLWHDACQESEAVEVA